MSLYLGVFAFFSYFCMIADPDESQLAHYLSVQVPARLDALATRLLGGKTMKKVHGIMDYFLVIVYLVVVLGSWSVIFFFVYPWIDFSEFVSNHHKTAGYFVFVACIWSWRKASTTSPGIITSHTIERYNNYPYDRILFLPNKICPTVGIIKLARSKYDRFSGYHVPRFDHFCGWLHNPVGEENYRWFLLFLSIHVGMCSYGTFCCTWLFYGEVVEHNLWQVKFYNVATGEEFGASYFVVFQYLFQRHLVVAAVLLLMSVMALVLGMFLGWHIWIASRGMTTNECAKWDQVKAWHKKQTKRYNQALKEGLVAPDKEKERAPAPRVADGDVTCTGAAPTAKTNEDEKDELDDIPVLTNPGKLPKNIYNRGIVENWKEILYPRSMRPDAIERFRKAVRERRVTVSTTKTSTTKTTTTVTHYPPPQPPEKRKDN